MHRTLILPSSYRGNEGAVCTWVLPTWFSCGKKGKQKASPKEGWWGEKSGKDGGSKPVRC